MRIGKILPRTGISAALLALTLAIPAFADGTTKLAGTMKLQSSAFEDNQAIPAQYTCDGKNISPPLSWSGVPGNTKSFALIVQDPDAPKRDFIHWMIWNIPAATNSIAEASPPGKPAVEGLNDMGKKGYGGPCPPWGNHHYTFTLYALDITLTIAASASKNDLWNAMQDHVLDQTVLTGMYQRPRR